MLTKIILLLISTQEITNNISYKIHHMLMNLGIYKKVDWGRNNLMTDRSIRDKICTQTI